MSPLPSHPSRPPVNAASVKADTVAGLTAAAVVLPKAMAYATVAGLPVAVGLYTALVPMALYALLGSSRVLNVSSSGVPSCTSSRGKNKKPVMRAPAGRRADGRLRRSASARDQA